MMKQVGIKNQNGIFLSNKKISMINVIAGKYKGQKLFHINNNNVRPTQAKVRKSIFDILGSLNDKKILDLYSGVGSFGIESLSRGASHLTSVESNSSVFKILLKNIKKICPNDDIKLHRSTVDRFLNINNNKFDIIFADPPYGEFDFFDLKENISKFLNLNGIFCMEMKKREFDEHEGNIRIKHYGNTQVVFWTLN